MTDSEDRTLEIGPSPDYYGYCPLILLARPVVLAGHLTEYTRAVAYRTSSLLGIPYHDVDRLIEHEIGSTLDRLIAVEGVPEYRNIEARCLIRVLREKPFGLIALGDGGLLCRDNLQRVHDQAHLVVLDFDLANLYWRIQRLSQQRDSARWHPLFEALPASVNDLRPFYDERRSGFEVAALRIDANGLDPAAACSLLMEWLQGQQSHETAPIP